MTLPTSVDFECRSLDLLNSIAVVCREADEASMTRVTTWLNGDPVKTGDTGPFGRAELAHPLSPWMHGAADRALAHGRTPLEMQALADLTLPGARSVMHEGAEAFARTLEAIARRASTADAAFRSGPVASLRDVNGVRVVYPSAYAIRPRLGEICDHARVHIDQHPALAAIVAMVSIMNVHPFGDANGRVARIVFNWILLDGAKRFAYLPLSELAGLSEGGFLLRLREAQYFGRWSGLIDFIHLAASRLFGKEAGS